VRLGGLGIRPVQQFGSLVAWWSSLAQAAPFVLAERRRLSAGAAVPLRTATDDEIAQVWRDLCDLGVKVDRLFPDLSNPTVNFWDFYVALQYHRHDNLQKHLTKQLDNSKINNLLEAAKRSNRTADHARLKSLKNPTCAVPLRMNCAMSDAAMVVYLRLRFGLAPTSTMPLACACATAHDSDKLHLFKCVQNSRVRTMAHDHVQNVLQQQMRAAGMFADTREVRLEQEQHGKIPDVHAVLDGHHVFVDVSGTTSSSTPSVRDGKFSSKLNTVTATHEREQEKVREYAPMVAIQKAEFFPFVFERHLASNRLCCCSVSCLVPVVVVV
jgi:hypothetical protein